jgi:4-hydroxybenzoate polyprenyltransferase
VSAERGSAPWRTLTRARRVGYALLPGESFSYLLHMRPREWPIMAAHTAIGFVMAIGLRAVMVGSSWPAFALMLVAWVVCLNGGTLALNSAFDRDEGDVGYLDAPPPPPRGLAAMSVGLLAAGQVIAFVLPPQFAVAYAICFALSLLYSVPPIRLKAVAGGDWIINIAGFGALTPYAGWAATGRPLTGWGAWVIAGFGLLFGSLYPLTQIYQFAEDRARGDRTLALALGPRASLTIALVFAGGAFAAFARGASLGAANALQWTALAVAGLAWALVLLPWRARYAAMSDAAHKRGMYAALGAWAVTDIAIVLAFGV